MVTHYRFQPQQESEEVLQRRAAYAAEQARLAAEQKRKKDEAIQRANDLLMMHLDEKQRRDWRLRQQFYVRSQSGKRFRIRNLGSMNIDEMDEGDRVRANHCIVAPGVPLPDQLLAQKLMLEHNEAEFMRVANLRTI